MWSDKSQGSTPKREALFLFSVNASPAPPTKPPPIPVSAIGTPTAAPPGTRHNRKPPTPAAHPPNAVPLDMVLRVLPIVGHFPTKG